MQLKTHAGWAWGGAAAGLLGGLVVFAPAHWLTQALEGASAGRLQLDDARGSVWQGSAQLTLTGGQGSRDASRLPGRLSWRLRPSGWGMEAQVQADCCMAQALQMRLGLRWGGWRLQVEAGRSQWPASLLAGWGTPWNTVQPEGSLSVVNEAVSLEWAGGQMKWNGSAHLDAQDIASRLSTLRPMGSYRLSWQANAALSDNMSGPTIALSTLQGALRLSGKGEWIGSRLRFVGEASAAPEREAALANLLNIIGRRSGARSIITVG